MLCCVYLTTILLNACVERMQLDEFLLREHTCMTSTQEEKLNMSSTPLAPVMLPFPLSHAPYPKGHGVLTSNTEHKRKSYFI